jgi:glycosyltransferase involved in cell wall biosynthesis
MRIGIDYRSALVNRDGIGRYTRELVRALVELGYDHNLGLFGYTLAGRRFSRDELGLTGSRAELVRLRLPSKTLPWLLRRMGKGVDDLVGGVEVYHHTGLHLLPVREAVPVATIHDCIFTLDGDGRAPLGERPGYMETAVAERMTSAAKRAVADARVVIVPSEFSGAEAVMALGVHPGRIHVTPLGCDHILRHLEPGEAAPLERRPARAQDTPPTILTVTRVDPRKNHLRMLTAFEGLVRDGFPHHWVVVGAPGWRSDAFAAALDDSPARERISWLRDVSERDLARHYVSADLFLFASLSEGFGLPPLEAMACGTPVVTSCVTSMPEVCGDAAVYVEPTDTTSITDALRAVLGDVDHLHDLSRRAFSHARRFPWSECARSTLRAYKAATDDTGSEPTLKHSL